MRFDLSDEEWTLLEPLMPKSRKSARSDDRKIMNAIFYVLRTGMPWRDLPERYGLRPQPLRRWGGKTAGGGLEVGRVLEDPAVVVLQIFDAHVGLSVGLCDGSCALTSRR